MEVIIQQIVKDFTTKIMKRFNPEEIQNIGTLTKSLLDDSKDFAKQFLEVFIAEINREIREDKAARKQTGLVLQEKNRKRSLYTSLGTIHFSRDYYYDKQNEEYMYPIDILMGIAAYSRVDDSICAELVNHAAFSSYAKSVAIVTDGAISRQSVRNMIMRTHVPDDVFPAERRQVKELHLYADEDHVHMQKPDKMKGKENQSVPLVVVTEGSKRVGKRRRTTLGTQYFVEESMNGKQLWKRVEGYLGATYDMNNLDHIYIHGDGGRWIENGLEDHAQVVHVMDGYHFEKHLTRLASAFPKRNVKQVLRSALEKNNKSKALSFLQSLSLSANEKQTKRLADFTTYIMNFWDEIHRRQILHIPGSCTEGQVSHALSERFSRNPMGWSKETLGRLSCIRIACLNGRQITGNDIGLPKKQTSYAEYAETWIHNALCGAYDWSIFEGQPPIFDCASGTQRLLMKYSAYHDSGFC